MRMTDKLKEALCARGISKTRQEHIYNEINKLDNLGLMREIISTELRSIQRGDRLQNKPRQVYWEKRMASLKECTRDELEEIAIKIVFDIK